jgi:ABC-type transport system involved in cytochrome c biogenesis permease subunit
MIVQFEPYFTLKANIVNETFDPTAERVESLKAATLGAFCLMLAYSLIALGNHFVLANRFETLAALEISTLFNGLVKVGVAGLSGFLFGVTYRYAIREDNNPHLQDGVVLAFGLVRGLAPIEAQPNLTEAFGLIAVWGIESVVCFAIARFALDWAIEHHWIKRFPS